jgi:predicted RNA-binding Zn-ribbon protein involved in translation (DUF1610 family)
LISYIHISECRKDWASRFAALTGTAFDPIAWSREAMSDGLIKCGDCGTVINTDADTPEKAVLCPNCGSNKRAIAASITGGQPLNSSVSNSAFEIKKPEIVKNSALALNRYFLDRNIWDEGLIVERGEILFAHAVQRWPYPT